MASTMDYARLREQTMGSGLDEEAVTVNTRALIDKVLARYSGEWTTLRELIQNAADAKATNVTVRFETIPPPTVPAPQTDEPSAQLKHVLLQHTLSRLLVSNNGEAFGENDWTRLKRIAEGNPDETKIGAFGVGFYSVFADCETPFVSSGSQTMAFYWKGNSLFTRRGRLTADQSRSETCFMLDYRNTTSPVPALLSLCQFLSTSLTFVGLESIDLWLDQWNILHLTKKMAPSATLTIPKDVQSKTKEGLMKITSFEYQKAQIDAEWTNVVGWNRTTTAAVTQAVSVGDNGLPGQSLRSFFSRFTSGSTNTTTVAKRVAKEEEVAQRAIAQDLGGTSKATVFLRISTFNVQTFVGKTFAQELERATRKPPPKQTKIAILTSSYDETAASLSTLTGTSSLKATAIFQSVLPAKNGRIFIGFPTAQTTGLLAHISVPSVIPTVERESIDLNARYVRTWNIEMLRVAGIACRIAYIGDLAEIKATLDRNMASVVSSKIQKSGLAAVMPATIHTLRQYTYHESTPSPNVGQIIEEAFWTCNQKTAIDILSTRGVLPSNEVRVASEDLSFVDNLPVVPDELIDGAQGFFEKLQEFGLISEITTSDIKQELERRALDENQLTEFLKWAAAKMNTEALDTSSIQALFHGTVATVNYENARPSQTPVLQLGQIKTFVNAAKIPAELPIPSATIPFRFTKALTFAQLNLFGWDELQIVPWLRYVVECDNASATTEHESLSNSPAYAAQVLPVISRAWDSLSQTSKATVIELLVGRSIIPTKLGMRKPAQAYFTSVKLFDDLPTITNLQNVKEKFLAALGVRKTVQLNVVFDRLMAKSTDPNSNGESKWSHAELIRYLTSVRNDIPTEDISRLRKTPMCPAENGGGRLYRVSELYEPKQELRDLTLPILHWSGPPFRAASPEASFLIALGLKQFPAVNELVDLMVKAASRGDGKLYHSAMTYFIANHVHNKYSSFDMSTIQMPFLPLQGQDLAVLALPHECFAHSKAAVLGFRILRQDLYDHAMKFGVSMHPPIQACANYLVKHPPETHADARVMFSYFAGRLNEIGPSGNLAEVLGEASIVPVYDTPANPKFGAEKDSRVRHTSPRSCFLGNDHTYGEIFDFVDFGQEANLFLLKIGSKNEPSSLELTQMLVREPARLLKTLSAEKYLALLRRLAEATATLKSDKILFKDLKRARCLLACREISSKLPKSKERGELDTDELDDDESTIKEYSLANAESMVLVDDIASYRLFKEKLLTAPQEDVLENFYAALGSPWLSSLVEDNTRMGPLLKDQVVAVKLQKLVLERCRLFLNDHSAEAVRHDTRWLEKNMKVQVTASLTMSRNLRGYNATHTEKRTAALHRETKKDATLFVTAKPDSYEVSRAIMSLLLKRPKQQDYLALETLMESDLRRLRMKGYNVDRILRQQAAEFRVAESERQKHLEEETRRLGEEEKAWKATLAENAMKNVRPNTPAQVPSMPGAFAESPEQALTAQTTSPQRPRKLPFLSNITKHLGFDDGSQASQQRQYMLTGGNSKPKTLEQAPDHPPPSSTNDPRPFRTSQPESVTAPHQLHQNLVSAIQACRSYDSMNLFSKPSTNDIKETPSYCDAKPGRDISFVADSKPGIKVFLSNQLTDKTSFLSANIVALNGFASLLQDCGKVFSISPQTLHIFYDECGSTIAFNSNGSLFCNFRYFLQLHWDKWQAGERKGEVATYWWVSLCHELAHNLVGDHSAEHSYYTESFVMQYFSKMVLMAARYSEASGHGNDGISLTGQTGA
ncbi:hypothetical protein LTR66_001708 [Elasticomyces elasticus]|nr:hypothetical protein LTR66_001708 [Elasticomyces elasticus]